VSVPGVCWKWIVGSRFVALLHPGLIQQPPVQPETLSNHSEVTKSFRIVFLESFSIMPNKPKK
jgi:hypothetical protein